MVTQTPWLERSFNFSFPVGLYPNLVERLRGAPARLEDLMRGLPAEIRTRRVDDSWSIQEHAGHLYCIDKLHETRLDEYLKRATELTAAIMTNTMTYDADFNGWDIDRILSTFRENRLRLVKRLEEVDEDLAGHVAHHPRLDKPMRLVDMLLFASEHDDHHFAFITKLMRTFSV